MKNSELKQKIKQWGGLTVLELRDHLNMIMDQAPHIADIPVMLTYDYGDRSHSQKCEKVGEPNIAYVEYSSYLSAGILVGEEPDQEEYGDDMPFQALILGEI